MPFVQKLFFTFLLTGFATLLVQGQSSFIHVDQFGYQTLASKVAVLSDPQNGFNGGLSYTPGASLEIKTASSNQTVWTGSPAIYANGATDDRSSDKGWWLDFSDLTTPGDYYINDPTSGEQSGVFSINDNVYDDLMKDAGRAFFYNRCNFPKNAPYAESGWTDGMNFENALQDTDCSYVYDPENAALRRDLSGGWFDAGDYNKYVTFAEGAVHSLFWAYRESSMVFYDNWNIPESGNGVPDLLDELKWETDWLMKMTNADGSTIIKMGSIDFGENNSAPPSANVDRRYYGPTCTAASIAAAGMLAHAAEVFADVPAFSASVQAYEDQAALCFDYWVAARDANGLETDCDDGSINAGDADRNEQEQRESALIAAIHLYSLTGEQEYKDYFEDHYQEAPMFDNNFWGPYKEELTSAMLFYATLPSANATVANAINNGFTTAASNNWNGFFGMIDNDLYRAFMPDWSFHWGSNSIISRYGNLNRLLVFYSLDQGNAVSYEDKAAGMLHYLHGVNPLGMVYLSGMEGRGAERGIEEIYHSWFYDGTDWDNSTTSLYGPAPGFVTGGPNKDFSVTSISPPAGQPTSKSYKDWNFGFPENSWEISEPAIYYQAAYIRNLAAQMSRELVLPVVYASPLRAQARDQDVLLRWSVSREENASHYEVQHLNLQDEWKSVGRVTARGLSRYSFVHEQPFEGINSYRLRQIDLDGSSSLTNVVNVTFEDTYAKIEVFPNPVGSGQDLQFTDLPSGTTLRLYGPNGQKLKEVAVNSRTYSLAMDELSTGFYGLELSLGSEMIWSGRILVQ